MKKKVLYKLPRATEDKETGRKILLNKLEKVTIDENKDFSSKDGKIEKKLIQKGGKFKIGKNSYVVHNTNFLDEYKQIKRKAQIITLKDIGPIISYTGLNKNSVVIDAGSGSGALACFLAGIVKQVDSFDIEDNNLETAKKNADDLKLKNINFQNKNVYKEKDFEKNKYDVFILDVPEPSRALNSANKTLKVGGFLVVYAPQITQIQEVVNSLPENLLHEQTIENIERRWKVSVNTLRPETKDFGHTAFLCIIRKIF